MNDSNQWLYIDTHGQQAGPVSADELQQLASTGVIHAETSVWTEGLEEWVSATQVEGLIPANSSAQLSPQQPSTHIPQIILGAGSGIHLESTIVGKPMGQSLTTPYSQPQKSPLKKIIFSVIALVLIGLGIMVAIAPSEEEKNKTIPGYEAYSKANKLVNSTNGNAIHGNNDSAITIAKNFSITIKKYCELAIEKSAPGLFKKEGVFPTFCLASTDGEQRTVVMIVQVPKLRKFSSDAKTAIVEGAWMAAKLALVETPYEGPKTNLVVAVRGMMFYEKVMIGHPIITESPEANLLAGVKEMHDGASSDEKLYPYFIKSK